MKRRSALALLAAASLLPGCFFVRTCVPMDASGMAGPRRWASESLADQASRTGERVAGLPGALEDHLASSWRNLTTDPSTVGMGR